MEDSHYIKVDGVVMKPRRKVKDNAVVGCFKRLTKKLYPIQAKRTWTKQGSWLRKIICACLIANLLFFVVSLAMIGFEPMAMNLILATWAYSVYLTMNELSIILYIVFLIGATINGIYWLKENDNLAFPLTNSQIMGFGMNMMTHLVSIYYLGRAYYYFRKTGGIKGLNPTTDLPEEKALRHVKAGANKVAEVAHKKMDEADKKDIEKDDEFLAIKAA